MRRCSLHPLRPFQNVQESAEAAEEEGWAEEGLGGEGGSGGMEGGRMVAAARVGPALRASAHPTVNSGFEFPNSSGNSRNPKRLRRGIQGSSFFDQKE